MSMSARAGSTGAQDIRIGMDNPTAQRLDLCIVFPYKTSPHIPDDRYNTQEADRHGYRPTEKELNDMRAWDHSRHIILHRLAQAGVEAKLFYSTNHCDIYCKVGCDIERLKDEADRLNYKLQLKEESPYFGAYAPYSRDRPGTKENSYKDAKRVDHLFKRYRPNDKDTLFRTTDRIHIVDSIIRSKDPGCAGIDIGGYQKTRHILSYFPLHERLELEYLHSEWAKAFFKKQPMNRIRDYFGEKIALYFGWLGFYTTWLVVPSLAGIVVQIAYFATTPQSYNNWTLYPFCIFMALWATFFMEFWKRKNASFCLQWGTIGYEEEEMPRPEFYGDRRISPVNDKPELYYPPMKRLRDYLINYSVITSCVGGVILLVISVFLLRTVSKGSAGLGFAANLLLSGMILAFNELFGRLARFLTDRENHRTQTEYENHLIAKSFIFKFINSYISLFYVAFWKQGARLFGSDADSCNVSCLNELSNLLGTVFIVRLLWGNFSEIVFPILKGVINRQLGTRGSTEPEGDTASLNPHGPQSFVDAAPAEKQRFLEPYDHAFKDYDEMILQFGYVTLFVVSFPMAPLLAIINNVFEIRIDAYKLTKVHRRPHPYRAEDLGTWYYILEIMSVIAVVTNTAIIAFAADTSDATTVRTISTDQLWTFIIMEHALLAVKVLVKLLVPDVPNSVQILSRRHKYVVDKYIRGVDEEDQQFHVPPEEISEEILPTDDDPDD
eukprot:GILJ01001335.1.p1 GENE.GILJ01001335.1~~GILJ01001335.1.p1  ORF type:complete len:740 (-),score=116.80 GILJ01001335.1:190-2355(-)